MAPKWLLDVLQKDSFLKYHAYYKVGRHNHKAQGIIAVARLCDSQEVVEKYAKYAEFIVKPYDPDEPLTEESEIDFLQSDNLEDYKGKTHGFYKILGIFRGMYNTKYSKDIKAMVKDVLPGIIDGPMFSAFHGIIQTGYGLASTCDTAVLEGITYMYQAYSPLFFDDMDNPKRTNLKPFGNGQTSLEKTIDKLRDEILIKLMAEESKNVIPFRRENHISAFGYEAPKYHSDFFMDVTNDLKLPDWFKPADKDFYQLERLIGWVIDTATVIYVQSNTVNDFFILHGITGAWSYQQVLPLLDYDSALLGLRSIISGLFMVYVHQGAPALDKKPEDYYDGLVEQEAWDKLIKEVLNNNYHYEIHIYKVIQCLYNRWQENPNNEYAKYHLAGAHLAKDNRFAGVFAEDNSQEAFE